MLWLFMSIVFEQWRTIGQNFHEFASMNRHHLHFKAASTDSNLQTLLSALGTECIGIYTLNVFCLSAMNVSPVTYIVTCADLAAFH